MDQENSGMCTDCANTAMDALKKQSSSNQASDSPRIDPVKAKQIQDGANKSGWDPAAWKRNLANAFSGK